jgi:methylated-DNA-[protein]-cysteine S-methyltransferase
MVSRKPRYNAVVDLPFGRVAITADADGLSSVKLVSRKTALHSPDNTVARKIYRVLQQYVRDPLTRFDLPLNIAGTDFQKKVWRALAKIPPGKPMTYGALAKRLNTSARAVGGACRENPVPVIVPCHRVTGAADRGGYMGQTRGPAVQMKHWLLSHEERG